VSRLHIYTVHVNPALPHPYEAAEFIEEGFNWKAFFFIWIWAAYNRLWWQAIGLFALTMLLLHLFSSGMFTHVGASIIDIAVRFLVGAYANDWKRKRLQKNGYITSDIVSGDSLLRGQQRFFDRYFATHPAESFVN
jgi:hypothetical protein